MGDVGVNVVPEVTVEEPPLTVVPWVVEADGVAVYDPVGVNVVPDVPTEVPPLTVVPGVPPEVPPLTVVTGMKQHCTLKTMSAFGCILTV